MGNHITHLSSWKVNIFFCNLWSAAEFPRSDQSCYGACRPAFYLHWSIRSTVYLSCDALQTCLLHPDGPCCVMLQSASDKHVNANNTPPPLASPIVSGYCPWHMEMWKALLYSYSHPCCLCMGSNSITSQARFSLVALTGRHLIYLL